MFRHFRIGLCGSVALAALCAALPRPSLAALESTQNYVTDAKARIAKGDLRGAEIELRNAVQANPSDPSLHIQLAQLYLDMQNLPAAEAEARLARQYKGPADQVDPLLAQALLMQNKFDELFRDVAVGARAATAESQVRLALGLGHLRLEEMDRAEPLLRDAERLNPTTAAPKVGMAQLLLEKGDLTGAQKEIDAALAFAPDDSTALRVSALILRAQGNPDAAIAKLTSILAKNPNDPAALSVRAEILMGQNKLTAAQADVDRALKLAPNNVGVIFLDGMLLTRQGKLTEADSQLSKANVAFGNLPYGYYLAGVVKYQLHQFQQAAADLSKYVARFPNAVVPRQLLARIDLFNRDYSAAIDVLKPALAADPSDVPSELLLAQAYLASGHRNDALELYQKAASAKSNDIQAQANLAAFEVGLGNLQGLAELDKLAQTATGAAVAGPTLVIADLRAGHIADAAKVAEGLVQHNPEDMTAQQLLGTVRMTQGNYKDAASIFAKMTTKDPTLPAAQRDLAQADVSLGKLNDAKTILQGLVKTQPGSLVDVIALAQVEVQQGDENDAADLLKNAQKNSPNTPAPGLTLLQIYRTAKEWDKALAYGSDLEGQFPANISVIDMIATIDSEKGAAKDAVAEYAKLVQAAPDSAPIVLRFAQYQIAAQEKAGALASLRKAVELAPHDLRPIEALVSYEQSADGTGAALTTASSFAKDDPQMYKVVVADVLQKASRTDEAVTLLINEQKDHPSAVIVSKLAELLYLSGKRDEAKQQLRTWIKDHDDLPSRVMLATLDMTDHDDSDARTLYEQVLGRSPYDLVALNNLAIIYAKQHDERALDYAEEAYRLDPSPNTADTMGWVLVSAGRPRDGLSLLREANAAAPENPSFAYHFAAALKAVGDQKKARSLLERAIASGSTFDEKADAQHLLDELPHS